MSVARVKYTKRAQRSPGQCEKCRETIAKGDPYRYYFLGFRSKHKRVRCMKPTCSPRTSELESSNRAEAYAAIETAQDSLQAMRDEPGEVSDVETVVQEAAEAINDVAQQYREADESFGGGGATQSGEIADQLEEAASELESFGSSVQDEPDPCADHEGDDALESSDASKMEEVRENCEACQSARAEWWGEVIDEADEALGSVSF